MAPIRELASPNCDDRPPDARIDMLVIHYTGMPTAQAALARLLDPEAKVSAHYLIEEDGRITCLVPEAKRAWHAGVSSWRGMSGVNACSIGVELVNPGHEFGYRAFAEAQMAALERLAQEIVRHHAIPARNVVGHADVAPTRKMDPGELFDWRRLARGGVGLWPETAGVDDAAVPVDDADVIPMLAAFGYDTVDATAALVAFQRHFARHRLDGEADAETRRTLAALLALGKV